jgi:hypothetical protein
VGVEDLDDLGEIGQRSRQSIDLVDDDHVDSASANVVQHPPRRRAIHRAAGIGAVVVERGEGGPTFVLLARDIGLAGFSLRVERIELLLEALPPTICGCRRRSGASRAGGSCFGGGRPLGFSEIVCAPFKTSSGVAAAVAEVFVSPKNRGPDHWVPVMSRAILVSDR